MIWMKPCFHAAALCALNLLPASWPSASVCSLSMDSANPQQLQQQLLEEFADVFDNSQLHPMDGPPMDIQLQPGGEPSCVRNARAIPFAYRDQVKSQLDGMLDDGIIEPMTEPSEWCHPIVLVPKKGSSEMRLTVDLRRLNDQVRRPYSPCSHASRCRRSHRQGHVLHHARRQTWILASSFI